MPCPIMTILKSSNFSSIDRVQAMKKVFVLELLRKFIVYITFSQLWDMLEVFYFKHTSKLSKCYCNLNILENLIINGSFVLISFFFSNTILNLSVQLRSDFISFCCDCFHFFNDLQVGKMKMVREKIKCICTNFLGTGLV